VEWTEDPTVGFNLLGTGGVTNLAYDSASVVVRNGKTLSFNHLVPTGKSYKYRVTADYLNQVDEANETNNVASAGYIASG
jgi:subtilase family serine protease